MIISIEGNIGSGKSTVLSELINHIGNFTKLKEPVEEWKTIKDEHGEDILSLFYKDKNAYAFSFQILAYITRLYELINNKKANTNYITERTIYTDKHVFLEMLYKSKCIKKVEYDIYNKLFDGTLSQTSKIDYIFYVDTTPENCLKRIKSRSRPGEEDISLEYLQDCDKFHRNWLDNIDPSTKVIYVDGNRDKSTVFQEIYSFIQNLK